MDLIYITNQPEEARLACEAGVSRIMLDLETLGKEERQKSRNAHMSDHTLDDLPALRATLPKGSLMVRINPAGAHSEDEISAVLDHAPDMIMLPMVTRLEEIDAIAGFISGRAHFIPLIEHCAAFDVLELIAAHDDVDELYLGLNDLSLSLSQSFVFEPLIDDWLDRFAAICQSANKPFGFGGIGSVSADLPISASMLLSEHARVGSSRAILSRAFRDVVGSNAFKEEIAAIQHCFTSRQKDLPKTLEENRQTLCAAIHSAIMSAKAG